MRSTDSATQVCSAFQVPLGQLGLRRYSVAHSQGQATWHQLESPGMAAMCLSPVPTMQHSLSAGVLGTHCALRPGRGHLHLQTWEQGPQGTGKASWNFPSSRASVCAALLVYEASHVGRASARYMLLSQSHWDSAQRPHSHPWPEQWTGHHHAVPWIQASEMSYTHWAGRWAAHQGHQARPPCCPDHGVGPPLGV